MNYSVMFDLIPVFMAGYALYILQGTCNSTETVVSKIAAVLLIICQSTWIHAYTNDFPLVQSAMDHLWTVFNSVVMLLVIMIAYRNRK